MPVLGRRFYELCIHSAELCVHSPISPPPRVSKRCDREALIRPDRTTGITFYEHILHRMLALPAGTPPNQLRLLQQ